MSSYKGNARNPKTEKIEVVDFMDDFYGSHQCGVRFEDGSMYRKKDIEYWYMVTGTSFSALSTKLKKDSFISKIFKKK